MGVVALSSKIVLVKFAVIDATSNTAEQRNRDLARLAHVIVQRRREIRILRVREVDLNPQAAHSGRSRISLNDEVVGHHDRRADNSRTRQDSVPELPWASYRWRCTARWSSDRFAAAHASTLRPAPPDGIQSLAENVEDIGTKLDRIGAAQLLNREADLECVRESVDRVNRRDRDLRRDVERPIDENATQALRVIEDLQRPCAACIQADQSLRAYQSADSFR